MDPNLQHSLEAQREQQRVIQEQLARQQETVRQQNEIREAQQRQMEQLRQHQEVAGRRAESGVSRGGPIAPTMRSAGSRPEIGPAESGIGGAILRLAVIVIVVAVLLFGPLHLWASFCTNVKTPIC